MKSNGKFYTEIDNGQIFAAIGLCIVNFIDAEGEVGTHIEVSVPSVYKAFNTKWWAMHDFSGYES